MEEISGTVQDARGAEECAEAAAANSARETFTQAQLDAIVASRLARERKGMLTPEEMRSYRDFLEHRKADAEKAAEAIKAAQDERDAAMAKLKDMENTHATLKKGIPPDKVDVYVRLAVACGESGEPFEEALEKALGMFPISSAYNGVPGSGANPPPGRAEKWPKRPEGVYAF